MIMMLLLRFSATKLSTSCSIAVFNAILKASGQSALGSNTQLFLCLNCTYIVLCSISQPRIGGSTLAINRLYSNHQVRQISARLLQGDTPNCRH